MADLSKLTVSSSPHIRHEDNTRQIMVDVIIALMPALAIAIYVFGPRALPLTAVSAAGCLFFEWLYQRLMKKPVTVGDCSALVTGILLAVARVSGETAPLLFTALWSDAWPKSYFNGPTANLPVLITEYATNSPFEEQHAAGWGAALVVTLMVLLLNISTRIIFKEKHNGR